MLSDVQTNELLDRIKVLEGENTELRKKLIKERSDVSHKDRFFEHVLENLPSDMVAFDKDHRYIFVNPKGISDKETREWIVGKTDFDFCKRRGYPMALAEGRRKAFNQVLQTKTEWFFEEKINSRSGEELWFLRRMFPVLDHKNNLLYVIGYATNITPIKKMEEDLGEEKRRSMASMKAKEEFLANMSHEIRTPMHAILGMSSLLESANLEGKHLEYLKGIQKSAKNLLVVINDILDYSKISANKVVVEKVPVCLIKEMEQLKLLFQVKGLSKDISFKITIDPKLQGTKLLADPVRLNQILNNLLSNAFKFVDKGKVDLDLIVLKEEGKAISIKFVVSDNGIGILKDQIDRILVPFSQADSSTTRKYGGTGLGLSITKGLIELMGGALVIDSDIGVGSTFSFVLEMVIAENTEIDCGIEEGETNTSFALQALRVLLVEDNELNQLYASAVLDEFCEAIVIANNGKEALKVLKENQNFDLILMDIQMPEMGGEKCTMIIRDELGLNIPIIALTANAFKEDRERYLKTGMNSYLSKPFEKNEFTEMMRLVLDQDSKKEYGG